MCTSIRVANKEVIMTNGVEPETKANIVVNAMTQRTPWYHQPTFDLNSLSIFFSFCVFGGAIYEKNLEKKRNPCIYLHRAAKHKGISFD